jgi:hypothetical protein
MDQSLLRKRGGQVIPAKLVAEQIDDISPHDRTPFDWSLRYQASVSGYFLGLGKMTSSEPRNCFVSSADETSSRDRD